MKNENFDEIKEMLNEEIEIPQSLSEDNIKKMLRERNVKQKGKKGKAFLKVMAVAASFVIVFLSAVVIRNLPVDVNFKEPESNNSGQNEAVVEYKPLDVGVSSNPVMKFQDEKDVKNYFLNMTKYQSVDDFVDGIFNGVAAEKGGVVFNEMESAPESAVGTLTNGSAQMNGSVQADNVKGESAGSFSQTNTQVQGVDEADIIKNDGRYLYIISRDKLLSIIDTTDMSVAFSEKLEAEEKDRELQIRELYLRGNSLIAVGNDYEKQEMSGEIYYSYNSFYRSWNDCKAVTVVYDISDKKAPQRLRYITQDGEYINSRMVEGCLYTVTSFYADAEKKYIPQIEDKNVDVSNIYVTDTEKNSRGYIVVSGYNTEDINGEVCSASVLGNYSEVYCSATTLYITEAEYVRSSTNNRWKTNIYAFSLDGGRIEMKKTGAVPGSVDNQFSMDENGGFFRIATTDYDYNADVDISSLYILDSEMNVIGKLYDIAKDEQIKSVRYMGNYAYVVTFRNTDPLFVIDLSKPDAPEIKGEVKLPGFSEYLHPISSNLLVGIGYDGDEESADFSSVKLSLFDVSDPTAPKEIDTHVIRYAYTEVNNDHRAFMLFGGTTTFGIPVRYDSNQGVSYHFKVMTVADGKFTEKQNYAHPQEEIIYNNFFRGAYIGETLYTISDTSVASFNMETAENTGSVVYCEKGETLAFEKFIPVTER